MMAEFKFFMYTILLTSLLDQKVPRKVILNDKTL